MNPTNESVRADLKNKTISQLAYMVHRDWQEKVYFGARPYLDAMADLNDENDSYGLDSAKSIVTYFLANATTWRGPVAREVKKELKRRFGMK